MASKYDIILITLVVVIFSVPTICADPCASVTCRNGGKCFVDVIGKCNCTAGYTGLICDKEKDLCEPVRESCRNGGKCVVEAGSPKCNCTAAYTGQYCDKAQHPCKKMNKLVQGGQFCKNGGTCREKAGHGTAECICPTNFTGLMCETAKPIPPQPDKTRQPPSDSTTPKISHSTTPTISQVDLLCKGLGQFCKHGGTCYTDEDGAPKCYCPAGYTDYVCATEISPCDKNTCQNNGTCEKKTVEEYTCHCPPKYTGKKCDTDMQSGDYLKKRLRSAIRCANDASIQINMTQLVNALVDVGIKSIYNLAFVNTDILGKYMPASVNQIQLLMFLDRLKKTEVVEKDNGDMCTPNPCKNGGKCEDVICDYECTCSTKYRGRTCVEKVEKTSTTATTTTPPNTTAASTQKKDATTATPTNKASTTNKPFQLILYTLCIIAIAALAFLGYSYRQKVRSWVCEDKDTKKGSKNIDYKRLKEEGTNKKMEIEIDRSEGSTYIY